MCYHLCQKLWGKPIILSWLSWFMKCQLGGATLDAHFSAAFIGSLFSRLGHCIVSTQKWTSGSCVIGEWFMLWTTTPLLHIKLQALLTLTVICYMVNFLRKLEQFSVCWLLFHPLLDRNFSNDVSKLATKQFLSRDSVNSKSAPEFDIDAIWYEW